MKKLSTLLLLFCMINISAQEYNKPESIVYDAKGDQYFISSKRGKEILKLDAQENLTSFVDSGLKGPKGLLIIGDTLISVNNTFIKGFLIGDATEVLNFPIEGSKFLNDATTDGQGNLYISDSNTDVIYKLSLKTGSYHILVDTLINPNGLLYDNTKNSILICNIGENAKIQSFSLSDSTLSDLVTTQLADFDGLARDNCGNIYVSSWASSAIYVFDPAFKNPPTIVSTGHNGPADISINEVEQILAVPNFMANSIDLINLNMGCDSKLTYIYPFNNRTIVSNSIVLHWKNDIGATAYELQYGTDSSFYSDSVIVVVETSNSVHRLTELESNTKYFWRVRSIGGDSKNIYGDVWSFTTREPRGNICNKRQIANTGFYPNPCNDYINFKEAVSNITITSHFGLCLFNHSGTTQQINVSNIPRGTYTILYRTNSNEIVKRVLIKR